MPDLTLAYSTVQLISYIHLSTFFRWSNHNWQSWELGVWTPKGRGQSPFWTIIIFQLTGWISGGAWISSEVRWFIPNPQQHKLQKWKAGEENYKFKSCNLSFDPRSWLVNDVFLCRKQTPQHHQATICAKITESACPLQVLGSQT